MNNKLTGSFYTPPQLVEYMVKHAFSKRKHENVLEPSVGDGRFLKEIIKLCKEVDGVELEPEKVKHLEKLKQHDKSFVANLICSDFINYSMESDKKYDLIIGNPPYVKKHGMNEADREKSLEIIRYLGLPRTIFQNLWVSFVLSSMKLLKQGGVIFFVLPFEFLQVQYAEILRKFLEDCFNTIEITTFRNKVFQDIEQDVCLVYMTNIKNADPIIRYTTVDSFENMEVVNESFICRNKPLKKWSNAMLSDDEISLVEELRQKYLQTSNLGFISPGIVTGANDYFIINKEKRFELKCEDFCLPILHKSSFFDNMLTFSKNDFDRIIQKGMSAYLLDLNNVDQTSFSAELSQYLAQGEEQLIDKRYKCSLRKRWFDVPIISRGDLLFFKRFNIFPKLVINTDNIYTTDVSYNIRLDPMYDKESVAFCFYNSLTITLCEFLGRFYGGGVNELVPSEFKQLCIPYRKINKNLIKDLDIMMRNNANINQITNFVDNIVFDDLDENVLTKLKSIREKYINRRFKNF